MHQAVETGDEEERLSASVTAVVADHCYTSSPTDSTTNCYSTTNQSYANQTPKQSHRVHSRSLTLPNIAMVILILLIKFMMVMMMLMLMQDWVQRRLCLLL